MTSADVGRSGTQIATEWENDAAVMEWRHFVG